MKTNPQTVTLSLALLGCCAALLVSPTPEAVVVEPFSYTVKINPLSTGELDGPTSNRITGRVIVSWDAAAGAGYLVQRRDEISDWTTIRHIQIGDAGRIDCPIFICVPDTTNQWRVVNE